jgi:N-acetylmuramoyl-L-alanine amidase
MRGITLRIRNLSTWAILLAVLCSAYPADAVVVVRQRVAEGVFASIRDGQFIFLECRPGGDAAQQVLSPYLADPSHWTRYKGLQSVAIPMPQLNGESQRKLIETLFPYDHADDRGWWHQVGFTGELGEETWHAVSDWLTGSNRNVSSLMQLPENRGVGKKLQRGAKIFVPKNLLLPGLRAPSQKQAGAAAPASAPMTTVAAPEKQPESRSEAPKQKPAETVAQKTPAQKSPAKAPPGRASTSPAPRKPDEITRAEEPQSDVIMAPEPKATSTPGRAPQGEGEGDAGEPAKLAAGELSYGKDEKGAYAAYKLKRGEAIYTAVVVRFTDFQERQDIIDACDIVLRRSGISDPRRIDAGQSIRIPMEILSDRYWPESSAERRGFEAMRQEAARLQQTRVSSKGLDGVVVVIDPGHGGNDQGASYPDAGLYEDELNYDIACRLKQLLESDTRAKVHFTLTDPKQGFEPRNTQSFTSDKNEELLTTPRYWNEDAKISANLRWYLANHFYEKECRKGLDPRKVVFISIHCDALHEKMRGTMVYVPGAKYRRNQEQPEGVIYARYDETNGHAAVSTTGEDRTRDEALSRNFAQTLIQTLQNGPAKIAVNKHGDPIRNVIRKSGGTAYVPAVLRNNLIPTKVLVETANLNNPTDRERLADPQWRQSYAEALRDALLEYFRN